MLQKQIVPIVFGQGIQTKVDSKSQVLGTFRRAVNVVFETINKFKKRNGYTAMVLKQLDETLLDNIQYVAKYKTELLAIDTSTLYGYSQNLDRVMERGPLYNAVPESVPVLNNNSTHDSVDCLLVEQFAVYIYHNDTTDEVRYSVIDTATNSPIVSNALVATGQLGRVAAINNTVFLIYADGTNIKYKYFSIYSPTTLTGPTTLANNLGASIVLDAVGSSTKVFVVYQSSVGAAIVRIATIDSDGSVGSGIALTGSADAVCISAKLSSIQQLVIAYADATDVFYAIANFNLSAFYLGETTLETISDVVNVDIQQLNTTEFNFIYEVSAASAYNHYLKQNDGDTAGAVGTPAVFKRSLSLAAKSFAIDGANYVVATYASDIQSTNFVLDSSANIVAKFSPGTAGSAAVGTLPQTNLTADDIVLIPSLVKSKIVGENGTFYSLLGINSTLMDYSPSYPYINTYFGENLHFAGGLLKMYDGINVCEHGFSIFPETLEQADIPVTVAVATTVVGDTGVTSEEQTLTFSAVPDSGTFTLTYGAETTAAIAYNASNATIKAAIEALTYISSTVTVSGSTATAILIVYDNSMGNVDQPTVTDNSLAVATTGGNMSDGSYGFKAVYRWTDNLGQDHYSAASTALEIVLAGGGSTQRVMVNAPTLRLTEKTGVVIEIYRTEDAGTIYYLAASAANDTSADTVSIQCTISDTTLISKQLLYTTGGVLENIAPPSVAVLGAHTAANRLIVVGENRNQIQYSKIREDGKPVEFNDSLLIDVDPIGGIITAVASMDEKLIIFEEGAIFVISGAGPNNNGEQDSYSLPERVSIDTGCVNPYSVVLTPNGLQFKSAKGIYLLRRDLGLEYIGAGAEDYNDLQITSAKLISDNNQVRYTTSNGPTIVYNYFSGQWGTFDNHVGRSAEVIDNVYYYARTDGQIFKQDDSYSDNGSAIALDVETGWMSFAQLQGFQRVYKLLILGDYKSAHKLRIQISYDFNEAIVQEVLIDPADFLDATTYGEDSPYGSGTPYGGDGSVYQMRVNLARQKCQAIKVRITEQLANAGQGVELSAITLQIGTKRGTNKLGASRKFTTS